MQIHFRLHKPSSCRRCRTGFVLILLLLGWPGRVRATQPVVAIHDSELTRALATLTATNTSTPTGPGTTGYQWWPTNWPYFLMPDALKEMLRSDGTAFTVVGDSNITAGALLDSNGLPNYPIVFSLASEAISNSEIAPLTNYVAAGGYSFIGSSAFTRNPDGSSRDDFALAAQMGIHTLTPGLTNWLANNTFTAVSSHPLISHIPQGTLNWQMPWSADEISWPEANHVAGPPSGLPHLMWQIRPYGATVLAAGDELPYLLIMPYGRGYFIYDAAMQPLLGHGGWAPGMYSYGIIRNAIQLAFQSLNAPVVKLSPWPYQYDAAVMFRHDMEATPSLIESIEVSAQYESAHGVRGDYFFCTGELRQDMSNAAATVTSLQAAVSNYGATISSHNGGLTNPNTYLPPLTTNSYDYWHWGPDEVLDSNPPGYTNGQAYALISISNSFSDIHGWGLDNSNGIRLWVAPYFNATRERSLQIEQQLGVQITGDDKLGPFPHFTLSSQTPDLRYSFVTLPVSDWFLGNEVAQAMEDGYASNNVNAMVDFYYSLGGLINLYSHSSSDGSGPAGNVASDYVYYSLSKPHIWAVNSIGLYQWWTNRAKAQVAPSFSTNGNQLQASLTVSGAADPNTAVEFYLPSSLFYGLQVSTNGVVAGTNNWRVTGQTVKVLVGASVTNVQIQYSLPPVARNDVYTMNQGDELIVAKPGVLANDTPGTGGTNLKASQQSLPAHGALTLQANGSFNYTPDVTYSGVDSFQYQADDAVTNSGPVTAAIEIVPPGNLFYDDFERQAGSDSILPWVPQLGGWSITNEMLVSTSSINGYGYAFYSNLTWTDYNLQAGIQFSSANAYGGGLGARLDPDVRRALRGVGLSGEFVCGFRGPQARQVRGLVNLERHAHARGGPAGRRHELAHPDTFSPGNEHRGVLRRRAENQCNGRYFRQSAALHQRRRLRRHVHLSRNLHPVPVQCVGHAHRNAPDHGLALEPHQHHRHHRRVDGRRARHQSRLSMVQGLHPHLRRDQCDLDAKQCVQWRRGGVQRGGEQRARECHKRGRRAHSPAGNRDRIRDRQQRHRRHNLGLRRRPKLSTPDRDQPLDSQLDQCQRRHPGRRHQYHGHQCRVLPAAVLPRPRRVAMTFRPLWLRLVRARLSSQSQGDWAVGCNGAI